MPVGLALEGRREHAEEVASGRPTDQGQSAGLFSLAYAVFVGKKKKKNASVSCPHLKIGRVPLKKAWISIF